MHTKTQQKAIWDCGGHSYLSVTHKLLRLQWHAEYKHGNNVNVMQDKWIMNLGF